MTSDPRHNDDANESDRRARSHAKGGEGEGPMGRVKEQASGCRAGRGEEGWEGRVVGGMGQDEGGMKE